MFCRSIVVVLFYFLQVSAPVLTQFCNSLLIFIPPQLPRSCTHQIPDSQVKINKLPPVSQHSYPYLTPPLVPNSLLPSLSPHPRSHIQILNPFLSVDIHFQPRPQMFEQATLTLWEFWSRRTEFWKGGSFKKKKRKGRKQIWNLAFKENVKNVYSKWYKYLKLMQKVLIARKYESYIVQTKT